MRPRLIGPTTPRLTLGQPAEPFRSGSRGCSQPGSRSDTRSISVPFGTPPPVWVLSLIATESIAGAESSRVWNVRMKTIGLGNAQGAVTGRELSGFRPLVAARLRLHSKRSYPRPGLGGENEPNFLDIRDCCKTSSVAAQGGHETVSEGGPRCLRTASQAGRLPGRDRSGLDRGLAALVRLDIRGENEPNFLSISDCCETSFGWDQEISGMQCLGSQYMLEAGKERGYSERLGS
jgi:hypothetical protein